MAGRLFAGAAGAACVATGVARHVLWYVSYHVDSHSGARRDGAAQRLNVRPASPRSSRSRMR